MSIQQGNLKRAEKGLRLLRSGWLSLHSTPPGVQGQQKARRPSLSPDQGDNANWPGL